MIRGCIMIYALTGEDLGVLVHINRTAKLWAAGKDVGPSLLAAKPKPAPTAAPALTTVLGEPVE